MAVYTSCSNITDMSRIHPQLSNKELTDNGFYIGLNDCCVFVVYVVVSKASLNEHLSNIYLILLNIEPCMYVFATVVVYKNNEQPSWLSLEWEQVQASSVIFIEYFIHNKEVGSQWVDGDTWGLCKCTLCNAVKTLGKFALSE